ncbi:serine/threonine-protein kinase [Anaeromyxobacter sp. Fw109-5]|uniref:serine/threonine-protein kinase n=1 Tax=Anaeromyxobacter sp. (strain Fw109-5) TaxID=404589 RepID=UPI0000ED6CD9|nr:serine/threonine-protein kinase [Anaeromyxobacter sp. Fw109-5]ABS28352.1 serine/threonine protein kinase [Anaeromyxobacter sp. Fw109-5]
MARERGHLTAEPDAVGAAAGAQGVSALLGELARAPEVELGSAWEHVLRPGAVVGRFELVREIGRGGFGVVYEARDRELGRSVAFKAVRAGDRTSLQEERLLREAEAAARLSHPNIVTVYDAGRCEHGPYLVLELLRGRALAERLSGEPPALRESLRVASEVASALAHAHAEGVVHRDLSPGNVFLCDDGRVKVLDFGLSHAFGRRRISGGTPGYMAPEQWRGAPEDERTDVYALGVMLYRMISGTLPFPEDEDGRATMGPKAAPALEVPDAAPLGALVARMLAKDPVDRPRDGAAVAAALLALRAELDSAPAPARPAPAGRPPHPRRRWAAAALAAVALALIAGGVSLRQRQGLDSPPAGAGEARVMVAVADFENHTGEPELGGLSGMLITSLEQSRRLSVLTRVRMLDILRQLGRENVAGVDEALGREVARSAGVRALVLASIRRFDDLYSIELKALDPLTSEYLFTLKETGRGKASVPKMIDRLSEETRQRLRESPAEVSASRVDVASATTGDFEAYASFFRGDQAMDATRYEQALSEYRAALAADPGFALAHYRIAYLGEFTGIDPSARRASIEAAMRSADRVPEKERLLIQAWKAHVDGDGERAHQLYARAVAAYPQDKEVLYMAGDLHFHEGNLPEALGLFERALALDPFWEPALMHVVDALGKLGRVDEVLARARRWVERVPGGASYRSLAHAELLAGRIEDAERDARRALELDGNIFSRTALAEALMLGERYGEAEALLRPATEPGAAPTDRMKASAQLAAALAYQGRRRAALEVLDRLPSRTPGPNEPSQRLLLLLGEPSHDAARAEVVRLAAAGVRWDGLPTILALTGELEAAAEHARALEPGPARALYEAVAAWRGGDRERALALLGPLLDNPRRGGDVGFAATWIAANVALEARRDEDAIASLRGVRQLPGGLTRSWMYPRSFYLEALALERLGQRARARESLDHLLALLRGADPDLPLLAEAKALQRRLAAPARAARR